MDALTSAERALFRKLSTPARIQDFLDRVPINHEKRGETCFSPRMTLKERKAHCLEGALFAAAALAFHGEKPLLMNLRTTPADDDHALALYRRNGLWGAVSKTNHASLRFRDPVYRSLRELALSYFHEYFFNDTGLKTLRAYSRPLDLSRFDDAWMTSQTPLWDIARALRDSAHLELFPSAQKRHIRKADAVERRAGRLVEWPESDPRT